MHHYFACTFQAADSFNDAKHPDHEGYIKPRQVHIRPQFSCGTHIHRIIPSISVNGHFINGHFITRHFITDTFHAAFVR